MRHPRPNGSASPRLLILFLSGMLAACGGTETEQHRLTVQDGRLFRGAGAFTLRGVEQPELGDPFMPIEAKAIQLNRLCSVGGNTIALDLGPLDAASQRLEPDWLQAFLELADQTQRRNLAIVLHIDTGGDVFSSLGVEAAIQAIAAAFPHGSDTVYWFTGPLEDQAVHAFQAAAPGFITASELGSSDLLTSSQSPAEGITRPVVVVHPAGPLPQRPLGFILSAGPDSYARLDATYRPPPDASPLEDLTVLPPTEAAEGFVPLFDGRSFAGWLVTGDASGWAVENGSIVWKKRGGGKVETRRRYDDFVLRFEWKLVSGGNSGVFLRAPLAGRESGIGMEFQLLGDAGEAPHKNGTGSIYDVLAPQVNASKPAGEWNAVEVTCDGPHFRAFLNGTLIQDVDLDSDPELRLRLRNGFIALQDHGSPVEFRNLRLKRLHAEADPGADETGANP